MNVSPGFPGCQHVPCSLWNGLFALDNLEGDEAEHIKPSGKEKIISFQHLRNFLQRYLTFDSRSTSSAGSDVSSLFRDLPSESNFDWAFFRLSTPANQSSSSSSFSWCLSLAPLSSVAAEASAATVDVEGSLSIRGGEVDLGLSTGDLASLRSPPRKAGSSSALRPSQSAELRCLEEAGLGFFSGDELRSSVENLQTN